MQRLLKVFVFSCHEAGVPKDTEYKTLQEIHCTLLEKMIHTHGNEFIQNRRMLNNIKEGKTVDTPTMLRDTLKILATQD